MPSVDVLFLSKEDIDSLDLSLDEIMDSIELGLKAHGEKKVIMPIKDHLPLVYPEKQFNILKGYVRPLSSCGVKVIGDFQINYEHDMPSDFAISVAKISRRPARPISAVPSLLSVSPHGRSLREGTICPAEAAARSRIRPCPTRRATASECSSYSPQRFAESII